MRGLADGSIWVIAFALICSSGLFIATDFVDADPELVPQVTPKGKRVNQNNSIDNNDSEKKVAYMFAEVGHGDHKIKVVSITFEPPDNYKFDEFRGQEKGQFAKYKRVDIASNAADFGVVADENGLLERSNKIKIYAFHMTPTNADQFKTWVEGNLKPNAIMTTLKGQPEWHWAVELEPVGPLNFLRLSRNQTFRLRSASTIYVDCDAINVMGQTVDSVPVRVDLYQDGNGGTVPEDDYDFWQPFLASTPSVVDHTRPIPAPLQASTQWILKAKHNATPSSYMSDSHKVPIVSGQWVERGLLTYQGFDDSTNPPWIVVDAASGISTASMLKLDAPMLTGEPNVEITINNADVATNTTPADHIADEDNEKTDFKGKSKDDTYALAKKGNVPIARLNISAKTKRAVTVTFHFLKDEAGNHGTINGATLNGWMEAAQDIWGPQAIIQTLLASDTIETIVMKGDLGAVPTGSALGKARLAVDDSKYAIPPGATSSAADIHVYVVWNLKDNEGLANVPHRRIIIRDNVHPRIFAHELGHAMGIYGHTEHKDDLMRGGGGYLLPRVRKWHADVVNP